MNVTHANKVKQSMGKNTLPYGSAHVLVAEYCCKDEKGFSIVINTPVQKQENHCVYGDRLQKIINEVHEFYQKRQGMEKLVKTIKVSLGDEQLLKNDKALVQEVFPKINELKQIQSENKSKKRYSTKISMQVMWKGSSKISIVQCTYLKQYEPQLFAIYKETRKRFEDKMKKCYKETQLKSKKRKNSQSMDLEYKDFENMRKMIKMDLDREEEVMDSSSQESINKNLDSTEQSEKTDGLKESKKLILQKISRLTLIKKESTYQKEKMPSTNFMLKAPNNQNNNHMQKNSWTDKQQKLQAKAPIVIEIDDD